MENIKLLADIFDKLTPEQEQHLALRCGGRECTYGEMAKAIDLLAGELIERGIKPGEHVALWSFNSLQWVISYMAIIKIGAVAIMPNYSLPAEDVKGLLERADVVAILYGDCVAVSKDAEAAEKIAKELKFRFALDLRLAENDTLTRLDAEPKYLNEIRTRVAADEPGRSAFVIFTTGTTSAPKAVLLHQKGIITNARDLANRVKEATSDSICIGLPTFHVFGLQWLITYLIQHKTIYLQARVGADGMIADISTYNIHDVATVGTIYTQLTEHKDFYKIQDIVHFMQVGGGRITPIQFMKLETAFTNAKLCNGLGMTESHGGTTQPIPSQSIETRAHTLGPFTSSLEVKIADADGKPVPQGQIGEILLRGDTVMNGYYGLPKEKQGFDDEGWYHAGDLGYLDENGDLHLSGRSKDIIIRNGENITPLDIETAIVEVGGVKDTKIYGAPHPIFGESVECCIIPENGTEFDEDAMRTALKQKLAAYKIPAHFFIYDEFPLMSNGKLDARGLKVDMLAKLDAVYVDQELQQGILVSSTVIKNTSYNVVPVSAMIQAMAESVGFTVSRAKQICLAVEEMLYERIINAYEAVGDITVRVIFMRDWMRIEFSDSGERYYIEKNKATSYSARIILKVVDNFTTLIDDNGMPFYALDFLYNSEFDIKEYILKHGR